MKCDEHLGAVGINKGWGRILYIGNIGTLSKGHYRCSFLDVLKDLFSEVKVFDTERWKKAHIVKSVRRSILENVKRELGSEGKYDYIHVELTRDERVNWYSALVCKRMFPSAALVATFHDPPLPFINGINLYLNIPYNFSKVGRLVDAFPGSSLLYKRLIKPLDKVMVLSEAGKQAVQDFFGDNLLVGKVDHVASFEVNEVVDKCSRDEVNLFFAGFWWYHKGIEVLIEAASHFPASKKVKLYLSGQSECKVFRQKVFQAVDKLPDHITVEYPGYLTFEQIYKYSQFCNAWIIPYQETDKVACSGVLNAAISMGAAIVASDMIQFNELIDHGKNGLLFRKGDAQALYECLRECEERSARMRLRMGALRTRKEKLDKEVIVESLKVFYSEINK